jgi:hypothetical protein
LHSRGCVDAEIIPSAGFGIMVVGDSINVTFDLSLSIPKNLAQRGGGVVVSRAMAFLRLSAIFDGESELFDADNESLDSVDEFFDCRVGRNGGVVDSIGSVVVLLWSCGSRRDRRAIVHTVDRRLECRMLACRRVDRSGVGKALFLSKVAAGLPMKVVVAHKNSLCILRRVLLGAYQLDVVFVVDVQCVSVLVASSPAIDDVGKIGFSEDIMFKVTQVLRLDVVKSIVVAFLQCTGGLVQRASSLRLGSHCHSQGEDSRVQIYS